eukprot:1160909-Pelagomonas_calceolata.AAC.3
MQASIERRQALLTGAEHQKEASVQTKSKQGRRDWKELLAKFSCACNQELLLSLHMLHVLRRLDHSSYVLPAL